ncbi:DeoR/GlpR transcriptional regulator [Paenibacillus sp. CGMCC 1.16610]|uniref:DeoR family transcriptional regulator n=1 Tax=Paenibacillus anseongense TaxID=2682845 RepID=A0ABW9UMI2_9BACL|nr:MULTISPECIES: DeoR/GlpR family DNA-binding transcription regulator [Paenibacillus]MBA2943483.1 DeoR/GlpR transcriptional regulator [Paenibacillus sp. CGMCC 1.16610]MVQ40462.1 DeoR family transcriptional regulator [Paenibacillus anseongense]
MFQEERLISIIEYLKSNKRITVDLICELYDVSRDTARRDMVKLEEQGRIVRTRGGAILPTLSKEVGNYEQRLQSESSSKLTIGKTAAGLIQDGDYIMMDASTTVLHAASALSSKQNVVVTSSIEIAAILTRKDETTIHILGGVLDSKHHSVYGAKAIEMLNDYHVDKLLIGTCGITEEGLSAPNEEDSYLVRAMIQHADQVIVLADHSKFGKRLFHRVVGFESIDILVTDQDLSSEMREKLLASEVEIVLAKGDDLDD